MKLKNDFEFNIIFSGLIKVGKKFVLGQETNIFPVCLGYFEFKDIEDSFLISAGFGRYRWQVK